MTTGRGRLLVAVAAVAPLLGGACSDDPAPEAAPPAAAPEPCEVFDPGAGAGCDVVGVTFATPLPLADVEAMAADFDGEPVALWRADAVCVDDVDGAGPSFPDGSGGKRASSFAYWHGDEAVALQDEGPPVTDGGWSLALRARFVQEWDAASTAGVEFVGGAFLVPGSADLAGDGTFAVASYRTDDVGVLYLRDHELALTDHFPAPAASCDQSS